MPRLHLSVPLNLLRVKLAMRSEPSKTDSYWFVRLGQIRGEQSKTGVFVHKDKLAQLSTPSDSAWRTGRCNPAFRSSELERYIFRATFRSVERILDGWRHDQEGTTEAYALKELKISSGRLRTLSRGLHTLQKVHEIFEITVVKYWYDPSWPEPHLPSDDLIRSRILTQDPSPIPALPAEAR